MNILKLVISIGLCLAAGFIGSLFTMPAIPAWYAGLKKPAFNPPPWVFGPVWTTLYILMGVALCLVWQKGLNHRAVQAAFTLFIVQLALNALWSVLFFGQRSPLLGLIDICLLWATLLATMIAFFRLSAAAGWLLVPYLLWVSFAAVLNYAVLRLNP